MDDLNALKDFFVQKIYLTPAQASEELSHRRKNTALLNEVFDFLGGKLPQVLETSPKAVLARTVATPNFEYFEFKRLAESADLSACCLEFREDKFRAKNFDKYYLGKLCFNYGKGRNGGDKSSALKVVDFDLAEGKKISELQTLWGENFVNFHHGLFDVSNVAEQFLIEDASQWINDHGRLGSVFYPYFLSLFICHGVLFENFLLDDKNLIDDMFMPALERVFEKFKMYPIIVPLSSLEKESDIYWRHYPGFIEERLIQAGKQKERHPTKLAVC